MAIISPADQPGKVPVEGMCHGIDGKMGKHLNERPGIAF
jgi:hypothetical protein